MKRLQNSDGFWLTKQSTKWIECSSKQFKFQNEPMSEPIAGRHLCEILFQYQIDFSNTLIT